jgi:hypothetical protein
MLPLLAEWDVRYKQGKARKGIYMKITDTDRDEINRAVRTYVKLEVSNPTLFVLAIARMFQPDEVFTVDAMSDWAREQSPSVVCEEKSLHLWALSHGYRKDE